ncbi:IclR family transcriptional regulator [Mycolicibacterium holsaticum]|uniref:Glycerol operon regulatory protein n=1 Tax=Mycolicibacterium holsaticum TaxID=152142 RepID=A0A1E3R8C8_9MYCO|nr:IclR family transcriptional regulator [Mycolicibacterium holsaticum]ODQ86175.1 hypothetical protein BHQ17_21600 [Mycolicibacterium holsaticum]
MNQGALALDSAVNSGHDQVDGPSPTNSVVRALEVLAAFGGSRTVLGVSEVAVRAGVPKSTAHRLLNMMSQHGFVRRKGNRYRLGERLFELGTRAVEPRGIRERAVPYMTELHHATLATVHLAVLHNDYVLYVEKIYGHGALPCPSRVGGSNPASCTALGKALLSRSADETVERVLGGRLPRPTRKSLHTADALHRSLQIARDDGFAVDYEELSMGLACVSAPIVDRGTGEAVAALSVSAPTARLNKRRFATLLMTAAEALSPASSLGPVEWIGPHAVNGPPA